MHINRTVKFILHKRNKDDATNLAIRMRCVIRGQKPLDIATGHHIDAVDWDADAQCARGANASVINRTLNTWRATMDEIFARYELIENVNPHWMNCGICSTTWLAVPFPPSPTPSAMFRTKRMICSRCSIYLWPRCQNKIRGHHPRMKNSTRCATI